MGTPWPGILHGFRAADGWFMLQVLRPHQWPDLARADRSARVGRRPTLRDATRLARSPRLRHPSGHRVVGRHAKPARRLRRTQRRGTGGRPRGHRRRRRGRPAPRHPPHAGRAPAHRRRDPTRPHPRTSGQVRRRGRGSRDTSALARRAHRRGPRRPSWDSAATSWRSCAPTAPSPDTCAGPLAAAAPRRPRRTANKAAPTSVHAWKTSWKPNTRGQGSGRLRRVDQRADGVGQHRLRVTSRTRPSRDPAPAAAPHEGAPAHHDVGHGDDPLRRVEPDLTQHDADNSAPPDQGQAEVTWAQPCSARTATAVDVPAMPTKIALWSARRIRRHAGADQRTRWKAALVPNIASIPAT